MDPRDIFISENPPQRGQSRSTFNLVLGFVLAGIFGGIVGAGAVFFLLRQTPASTPQTSIDQTSILTVALDLSTAVTDAVAEVGPTVVTVVNNLPPQRTFFGTAIGRTSSGSGVIISSEGHIVTNNHVVEGAESLEIIFADGSTLPASLIGVDPYADLAVVQSVGNIPAFAGWGNSDYLKPGESVIAIGSPLGDFKNTVTVGVVSATERSIDIDQNYQLEGLIQTDAAINQGNSGGPLVNLAGQVVGINTLIVRGSASGGGIAEGLGFAIPSNTARAIVAQLIENGYVSRPNLGIRWGWITPSVANRYRLPVEYGVYLSEVFPGGPADDAGLRQGDILISIDGQMLNSDNPFINVLFEHRPGETTVFSVVRGDVQFEVMITISASPEP